MTSITLADLKKLEELWRQQQLNPTLEISEEDKAKMVEYDEIVINAFKETL